MARAGRLLAILVVSATCAQAHADGSGSDAPRAPKKPLQQPEEEHVAPTGLIIAGVALAAFAVLLLVGRRKKGDVVAPAGQLAEVHLIIETDERATVWTSHSGLKLQTDRLGEVTLHLPVGRHDVHLQVGAEQYTRSISVNDITRMRIPINIAKERIARTKSGDFSAMPGPLADQAPGRGIRTTDSKALISDLPTPGMPARPLTSAARAYPDAASQSELGSKLAGLIDVELDSPKVPAGPQPATPPKGLDLSLDPGAKGDIASLDFSELATPQPAATPSPKPSGLTLDLGPLGGDSLPTEGIDFDVPLTPPPVSVPQPARQRDDIAALPPPPARPSPLADVLGQPRPRRESALGNLPARNRPPTSPLDGIVRESPVPARAPVLPKAPSAPARSQIDISLDDIAQPQRSGKTMPPPVASAAALLADLPNPPKKAEKPAVSLDFDALGDLGLGKPESAPAPAPQAGHYELAPPQAAAPFTKEVTGKLPSVADFSIGDAMPVRAATPPPVELPKVTASSVADLSLDEDDLPVNRIPARTNSNRKVPSVADFNLDDSSLELTAEPVSRAMPKALPAARAPVAATSELDDILAPAGSLPPVASPGGLLGDRFRKGAAMGGGPLGQLFRGRDETAKRDVLIEEVPRDVTLPAPASQLAALTHANLVTFYDHVVDPGAAKGYLVTELVEGKSLQQLLAERGSLSALEAIGIIDQVCAGLAAAHARNVFHRCVRPACIVMAGRTVKLTGFAWSPATRPLVYTAPEIAAGGAPDARADLYSIGITLAELMSGTAPIGGKLALPSDVPRNLVGLVRKLVSGEPMIRPASVKAVRDAFSTIF